MTRRSTFDLFDFDGVFGDLFSGYARQTPFPDARGEASSEVDVPGCTNEDVDVSLKDGMLSIQWKRRGKQHVSHFLVGRDVEPSSVTASVKNGVLTVQFPQRKPAATEGKITVT